MKAVLALVALTSVASADEVCECTDSSDVVGYRHCPTFATWGDGVREPYMFVEVGVVHRHFVTLAPDVAQRTTMPSEPASSPGTGMWLYDERIGVGGPLGLFAAVDFEVGNFGPAHAGDPESVLGGLVEVGLQQRISIVSVDAELAGGGLATTYSGGQPVGTALAEARVRADIWLTPWATLGGVIGSGIYPKDSWMLGLEVGFHTHAWGHR